MIDSSCSDPHGRADEDLASAAMRAPIDGDPALEADAHATECRTRFARDGDPKGRFIQ